MTTLTLPHPQTGEPVVLDMAMLEGCEYFYFDDEHPYCFGFPDMESDIPHGIDITEATQYQLPIIAAVAAEWIQAKIDNEYYRRQRLLLAMAWTAEDERASLELVRQMERWRLFVSRPGREAK